MPTTKDELEILEKMEPADLEWHLRELLKESRYLVVIDDVWDIDAWASLRRALPDNKKGSRVIITTHKKVVAESSGERKFVHELPFLQEEESWELFCKKVFPDYDEVNDKTSHCPPSMEKLARDMVRKCRGLPLAIAVLGGLLSRKHPDEWPQLQGRFWRHVSSDDFESHDLTHVTQILALSFNDLPYHLKSCFLYLGLFPEDFKIDAVRLIRLWMAEGFIQEAERETLEKTGAEYLNELIDRNLIQVAKRNWMRIVRCRVHDLLRDFAIEKSKELNFFHIYDRNAYSAPSPCKHRRLAFHSCGLRRFDSFDQSSNLRLRTLLFFNSGFEFTEIGELQFLYKTLRLLRVLDLEIFNLSQETEHIRLLDAIEKFIHLRESKRFTLDSVGRLRSLQTLCLHANTDTIWNLTLQPFSHFQHLLQLKLCGTIGKLPIEMHEFFLNLKCLGLDGLKMEEDPMPSLEKLPKLTILDLHVSDRVNNFFCTAGGFPQLEILTIFGGGANELHVDEGGMPLLQGLVFYYSDSVSIPERLRSIRFPKNWALAVPNEWPY
ncbi:hypothetical protein TEA_027926 [Camellia sinensis var. sinensis]|uniref:Uncharacterized protein n=1 Tax=Camellia sinensis var. sinensis TaxID=542762 RepID=A0A4S4EZ49_CAMSN|nr:hypothetical protein TEA_027926 [Camellia sinensis var. sinensis]